MTQGKLSALLPVLQSGTSGQVIPHAEQIKALIRMRGVTLTDLAAKWGYSESVIRIALQRPWPKVERRIAKFLGVRPQELWPDRYDAAGNSLVRERRAS